MKISSLNTKIKQIEFTKENGAKIEISGMIQNIRILSWGGFIILRTTNYNIQLVVEKESNIDLEMLKLESYIKIKGVVKAAKIKDKSIYPRDYEINVSNIEIISEPSIYPLPIDTSKKELKVAINTNFDLRPLTLRHPTQRAIFKISACINNEFGNYLTSIGFTKIVSPKIVFSGAEGGTNVFSLEYFGKTAFLAQSPQFYKQMMVGVFGKVFETGTVFRAEKHNTSRHMNEYYSLDYEMIINESFEELIEVEAKVLNSIFNEVKNECFNEVELLDINVPNIDNYLVIKFKEVHDIVFKEYKKDFRNENDLSPEEEKLICKYAKKNYNTDFVFVTHYPTVKRPFYTMDDPNDIGTTLSFDLLFRGMEITTGGQRLHKYDDYVEKMNKMGLNPDEFKSYLQTFQFGMPPHGGLAIGLERLTALICGLDNIKEASLFPRDIDRLTP